MAADERNFRSTYYEKVGCRSVEEKKSLEIILKDKPLDRTKLKQFCLRFCVPDVYRNLLWKLMLDVLPVHIDCHSFIMKQREQEYNDLLHALQVMRIVEVNTPKSHMFLAMWLLQTGNLICDINLNDDKGFIPIVQSFMQYFDDDVDVYWLAKNFYDNVLKMETHIPKLTEKSLCMLEKEDHMLYRHLQRNNLLEYLPMDKWFDSCFAGILHDSALAKIWDKFCCGCYQILAFVVVALLMHNRNKILRTSDINNMLLIFREIPPRYTTAEITDDNIATKSIELWQQYGHSANEKSKQ